MQDAPAPDAAVIIPERPAFIDALVAEVRYILYNMHFIYYNYLIPCVDK